MQWSGHRDVCERFMACIGLGPCYALVREVCCQEQHQQQQQLPQGSARWRPARPGSMLVMWDRLGSSLVLSGQNWGWTAMQPGWLGMKLALTQALCAGSWGGVQGMGIPEAPAPAGHDRPRAGSRHGPAWSGGRQVPVLLCL